MLRWRKIALTLVNIMPQTAFISTKTFTQADVLTSGVLLQLNLLVSEVFA